MIKETITSVIYVSGQQYQAGQAVYPDQDPDQSAVFPDGTPLNRGQKKKSRYVFVWKTWGKSWPCHIVLNLKIHLKNAGSQKNEDKIRLLENRLLLQVDTGR